MEKGSVRISGKHHSKSQHRPDAAAGALYHSLCKEPALREVGGKALFYSFLRTTPSKVIN